MKRRVLEWAESPMCITEGAFRAALARVLTMPEPLVAGGGPEAGGWEDFVGPPAVYDESLGSVRIIHISGVIERFVPKYWREVGFADVELIADMVRAAVGDEAVESIVLAMNTPGGTVWGTPEAAEVIAEASRQKPIVVHASNLLCSGGYYLAAGASAIMADPSASIGCVGVYVPLWDFQGMYERFGIGVDLVKSGSLKGAGYPGTPWTEEQRAHVQERVDDHAGAFKSHVTAHREIAEEYLTGGDYVAPRAMEYGFIDGLSTLEGAIALAGDLAVSVKQNG